MKRTLLVKGIALAMTAATLFLGTTNTITAEAATKIGVKTQIDQKRFKAAWKANGKKYGQSFFLLVQDDIVRPVTEYKPYGTDFINKKVSKVTPKVTYFKRVGVDKATLKVTVPKNQLKKLGNKKQLTVAFGSTKGKNFENFRVKVNATKKGNVYTATIKHSRLKKIEHTYVTVRFDGKTNWSAIKKINNWTARFGYRDRDWSQPVYMHGNNGCGSVICGANQKEIDKDGEAHYNGKCKACQAVGSSYTHWTGYVDSYEWADECPNAK